MSFLLLPFVNDSWAPFETKLIFLVIKNNTFVTSLTYSDPGFDSFPALALPSLPDLSSL